MVYRKDLDGLRAVAVLLVVVFHAFPALLPNGYLGVDIFFVISGFLITTIIFSHLERNSFSFINFYIRRIKRILPVSLTVLVTALICGSLTFFNTEFKDLKIYIKAASGFYINFQLLNDIGYFDIKSTFKPLLHFWSLSIEEQFYFVWPFISWGTYKATLHYTKSKNIAKQMLVTVTGLLLIFSFYYYFHQESDLYFSTFTRSWELLCGCFTALIFTKIRPQKKLSSIFTCIALILLVGSLLVQKKIAIILSVVSAILYVISDDKIEVKKIFKGRSLTHFGLISYSFYLWHWPFLSFYRTYSPNTSITETILLIALAYVVSVITYRYVELPLKHANWDFANRNLSKIEKIKILVPISSLLFVTFCLFKFNNYPKLDDRVINSLVFVEDSQLNLSNECIISNNLVSKSQLTWCYTEKTSATKINGLVWGDSHAHSIYRGLVGRDSSISWQLTAKHSCPPYIFNTGDSPCTHLTEEITKALINNSNIQYVVLVMANRVLLEYIDFVQKPDVRKKVITQLKSIVDSGKKIIIMRPVPEIAPNIYACTNQRFSFLKVFDSTESCRISFTAWSSKEQTYLSLVNNIVKDIPNIQVFNPAPYICDTQKCYATKNGKAYYEDQDHLSFYGAQIIGQHLIDQINLTK